HLSIDDAASLIGVFERRVVFVDLVPVGEPGEVLPASAQSLGPRGLDHNQADEWLRNELGQVPLLLVLDNAEHVLGATADIVGLVRACPRLRVLVTRREPLMVQVDTQAPETPLPIADPRE